MAEALAAPPTETNPFAKLEEWQKGSIERQAAARAESTQADIELKQAESARDLAVKQAGVEAAKKGAEETRGLIKKYGDMEMPYPSFQPTQESLGSYAQLASMIMTMGVMLGAGGKAPAKAAIASMTGMMDGWRKGRQDLWNQESKEFEKNLQKLKAHNDQIKTHLERALQLASTDQKLAREEAETAAYIAGHQSIPGLQIRSGKAKEAWDTMVATDKLIGASLKTIAEQQRLDQRHREDMAARQAQHAERMEMERQRLAQGRGGKVVGVDEATGNVVVMGADGQHQVLEGVKPTKTAGAAGGALPKDTKTNDEHRFRHSAIQNLEEVLSDLQKPEVRKLIGPQNQYVPDVLLNLREGFPALAQKLARFQSEEFRIGGKSLTKSEQNILGPIYNWRGLTVSALEENLNEAVRTMGKEQQYLENRYPGLAAFDYGGGARTATAAAAPNAPAMPTDDVEQERSRAKAAIASGKDEAAVRARFKQRTGQEL